MWFFKYCLVLIKRLWCQLLTKIVLIPIVRDEYLKLSSEIEPEPDLDKKQDSFLQNVHRATLAVLILAIAIFALIVILLSWPPSKGENVSNYQNPNSIKHVAGTTGQISSGDEGYKNNVDAKKIPNDHNSNEHDINKYRKEKRDLNSQEGMWRAANALVLLTIIQVLVGGMTMYFLIMTFRTQRSELGAANRTADAAENAERAYVFLEFETEFCGGIPDVITDPEIRVNWFRKFFSVTPKFYNYGKIPAISFNAKFALCNFHDPIDPIFVKLMLAAYDLDSPDYGDAMEYFGIDGSGAGMLKRISGSSFIGAGKSRAIGTTIKFNSLKGSHDKDEIRAYANKAIFYAYWSYTDMLGERSVVEELVRTEVCVDPEFFEDGIDEHWALYGIRDIQVVQTPITKENLPKE